MIITGGECKIKPVVLEKDFVIACDYGYKYCEEFGITPDLIVGDFDSYPNSEENISQKSDKIKILKFQKEKDDTDTMIAIKYAIENEIKDIVIYGAFGGRLDHMYANIQSAVYAVEHDSKCMIIDENNILYVIKNNKITINKKENYSISIFSHTNKSFGVNSKGLKYQLEDFTLENSFPIGVSNEFLTDFAEISVKKGTLIIILSKI